MAENNSDYSFEKFLKDIFDTYIEAKRAIIQCENKTELFPLTCLNELRDALDHIFRSVDSTNDIKKQFDKAKGHLKRATYDAYSLMCNQLIKKIRTDVEEYPTEIVFQIFPKYYSETLKSLSKIDTDLINVRDNSVGAENFDSFEDVSNKVIAIYDAVKSELPKLKHQYLKRLVKVYANDIYYITNTLKKYSNFTLNFVFSDYESKIKPFVTSLEKYNSMNNYDADGNIIKIADTILSEDDIDQIVEYNKLISNKVVDLESAEDVFNSIDEVQNIINAIESLKDKYDDTIIMRFFPDYYNSITDHLLFSKKIIDRIRDSLSITKKEVDKYIKIIKILRDYFESIKYKKEPIQNAIIDSKKAFWKGVKTAAIITGIVTFVTTLLAGLAIYFITTQGEASQSSVNTNQSEKTSLLDSNSLK